MRLWKILAVALICFLSCTKESIELEREKYTLFYEAPNLEILRSDFDETYMVCYHRCRLLSSNPWPKVFMVEVTNQTYIFTTDMTEEEMIDFFENANVCG